MAKRKQYPLRIDSEVWAGIERWAADDLRSVNAQVEFILRRDARETKKRPRSDSAGASVRSGRKGEGGYASTSSRSTTSSSFSRAGAREESCSEPCTRPSFVLSSLRLRSARTGLGWSSMR